MNKKSIRSSLFAALLAAGFVVGAEAQTTINYNFNAGQADFESTFSRNGSAGDSSFVYFASGGVADSGRVRGNGSFSDSAVLNNAWANTGTITISALFKTAPTLADGDVIGVGLYLTPATNSLSANQVSTVIDGTTSGLVADSWFLVTLSLTNNTTSYASTVTLQPYDAFGNATGSAFSSGSAVYVGSSVLAAATVYAGVYGGTGGGNSQGARAIDNFSVTGNAASAVPEPSTYAVILGAAALGAVLWRRRR